MKRLLIYYVVFHVNSEQSRDQLKLLSIPTSQYATFQQQKVTELWYNTYSTLYFVEGLLLFKYVVEN